MRTIKTLGIATAMALALVAFAGAGSASANTFKAEVEPEKWAGSLSGATHKLWLGEESFACSKVAFSGETQIKTVSSVQVTPELNGCSHKQYSSVGWTMNGCKFKFYAGAYQGIGGMDIVGCEKSMRTETEGCITEIPWQSGGASGLSSVEYKNAGSGSTRTITVIAKLTGILYTRSGVNCSAAKGSFSNGTYTGEWTVKGSWAGVQKGLEIESTPLPPGFYAEESPATLSGINSGYNSEQVFSFGSGTGGPGSNGQLYCESTTYSGTTSIPTEVISLAPTYHGCYLATEVAKTYIADKDITAGGCSYQLQAKGGLAVVGASCTSSPITVTVPGCVLKVGPQGGFPGPTYKNEGSGKLRTVKVMNNFNTEGLTYTAEGTGCATKGTIAAARPKLNAVVSAKNTSSAAQGFWVQ